MGFIFWRKNRLLDKFGLSLANDFSKIFSPKLAISSKQNKADKKLDRALSSLQKKIKQYRLQDTPGVYKKARIMRSFIMQLESIGYDAELIEKLKQEVLMYFAL